MFSGSQKVSSFVKHLKKRASFFEKLASFLHTVINEKASSLWKLARFLVKWSPAGLCHRSPTSVRLTAGPLESYSGNVSNQDTASTCKQHHSRIWIATKNMIDHMFSEQVYFFFFFFSFHTCHTWDLININMLMLSHSIRISSWLRRNSHCGKRRSHRVL